MNSPMIPPTTENATYFAATSHLKETESVPRAFIIPSSRSSFLMTDLIVNPIVKRMIRIINIQVITMKNVISTETSAALLVVCPSDRAFLKEYLYFSFFANAVFRIFRSLSVYFAPATKPVSPNFCGHSTLSTS